MPWLNQYWAVFNFAATTGVAGARQVCQHQDQQTQDAAVCMQALCDAASTVSGLRCCSAARSRTLA